MKSRDSRTFIGYTTMKCRITGNKGFGRRGHEELWQI
jgi:hypothetical protein